MLAQNFKTAEELKISDVEHAALIKTLGYLERGDLPGTLDLNLWCVEDSSHRCGTVACIAGWAWLFSDKRAFTDVVGNSGLGSGGDWTETRGDEICNLFLRGRDEDAPAALRNFLTIGEPRWAEVSAQRA